MPRTIDSCNRWIFNGFQKIWNFTVMMIQDIFLTVKRNHGAKECEYPPCCIQFSDNPCGKSHRLKNGMCNGLPLLQFGNGGRIFAVFTYLSAK
jgi:hypothetical protein